MRGALQRDEFVVHYQPTVRLKDARIDGLEALVRWRQPGVGLVPPAEFIPVAEENGFITELGAFVLRAACLQTRRWQRLYPDQPRLSVAVNVSPRQLSDPGHAELVASVLEETSLDPHNLILEVTESLIVREGSGALEQLRELYALGVRIAIDDFGTGYSSLSRLHRLPVSRLKIDQSFVAGLEKSDEAGPLVTATIEMAHGLGMETTAEGIETREQWTFLRRHGCEDGQGYLLSRPVDATAIDVLLQAKRALIRAGNGPATMRFRPAKITSGTAAVLIATSLASGWVGASAAPAGATIAQRLATSATASVVGLSAGLIFGQRQPTGVPPRRAAQANAPAAAQAVQVANRANASHAVAPGVARNPKTAEVRPLPVSARHGGEDLGPGRRKPVHQSPAAHK
jgi:EAL domain-containing protein (putative c-di-GMP-specific phosphodiesterase class I)